MANKEKIIIDNNKKSINKFIEDLLDKDLILIAIAIVKDYKLFIDIENRYNSTKKICDIYCDGDMLILISFCELFLNYSKSEYMHTWIYDIVDNAYKIMIDNK